MKYIILFLLFSCGVSACPEILSEVEIQPEGIVVSWMYEPEIFYAQVQVSLFFEKELITSVFTDKTTLEFFNLTPGSYSLLISYLYPSCSIYSSPSFIIEQVDQFRYSSSSRRLYDLGLWMLLGTVIVLCIMFILRR